jgi:MFS family permease
MKDEVRPLGLALVAWAAVLFFSMPASPWEFDEPLFFQALHRYDPVAHHPPPPGYPLFIGAGKVSRAVMATDFTALRAISLAASAIGFLLLALAIRNFTGEATVGVACATLFYFSPGMLVHATLPISEPGAIALLAAALYFGSRSSPGWFAFFAALTVGWRIQFTIFVVPMFLIAVLLMKRWRDRGLALAVFTITCLLWLIPLAMAVGGLEELVKFETGQGRYLAAHDADQSRSGWSPAMIALRFLAHPWGVKLSSIPLLGFAALGLVVAWKRRKLPIAFTLAGAGYITFALLVMDPADGVRYAIPFTLVTAFLAATGVVASSRRFGIPVSVLPMLFAAGSLVYVSSLLYQRSTTDSPPVRAIEFARRSYPKGAVAVYELPLWPHATYYLRDFNPRRLDDAMARLYDRPEVPMFVVADGASLEAGATTFSWAPSDAYSKLTRNHYRVVSIIPVPPERRFRAVRGVYGAEREVGGLAWRWLAPSAEIQMPPGGTRTVTIELMLPLESPIERNEVSIAVDGIAAATHTVERGPAKTVEVELPPGSPTLTFTAARSFVPAGVAHSLSRDARRLSVKLLGLSSRAAGARAAQPGV